MTTAPGIALALGGGGARGLAHVGVLAALEAADIPVRGIAGTSIGAEVGAFVAAGVSMQELKRIVFEMDWLDVMRMFVPDFREGALTDGEQVENFLRPWLGGRRIEDGRVGLAVVASDLATGEEVVFDRGDLLQAVRASIAFPGLIAPVRLENRLLTDGGVVNPVPFDVARARFGGPVVAVYVHPRPGQAPLAHRHEASLLREALAAPWLARWPAARGWAEALVRAAERFSGRQEQDDGGEIGILEVLLRAQMISEHMLVRLRERTAPPDVVVEPAIGDIGLLEFHRGREAFDAGFAAATAKIAEIRAAMERRGGLWARVQRWWS